MDSYWSDTEVEFVLAGNTVRMVKAKARAALAAAVRGYRLLTREAARWRTYFPKLDLIAPT